jgi:dihydrofolate synthase/folylpolyglutamate synthase
MKIRTMADVEIALQPYLEVASTTIGADIKLDRTEALLAHIGNPHQKLRIVHIAGTSGKTSTAYYIAALLRAAGAKVGHTVSPHVDILAERVQINGTPLSEAIFCEYFAEYLQLIEDVPNTPSWFECIIGLSYWVFAKEGVEYAVVETGLGGLHDSTNVAARSDKLCVLTDIGYDHMNILGSTLEKIAYQKAGIIHDRNTAIMYDQAPEVMHIVRYWVSQQEDAELLTFEQTRLEQAYGTDFADTLPEFQKRNWLLAYAAYLWLVKRDDLKPVDRDALLRTQETYVPGRMDRKKIGDKTIVFDGAHNGQKMHAFVESFCSLYSGRKVPLLLALKEGKEIADM